MISQFPSGTSGKRAEIHSWENIFNELHWNSFFNFLLSPTLLAGPEGNSAFLWKPCSWLISRLLGTNFRFISIAKENASLSTSTQTPRFSLSILTCRCWTRQQQSVRLQSPSRRTSWTSTSTATMCSRTRWNSISRSCSWTWTSPWWSFSESESTRCSWTDRSKLPWTEPAARSCRRENQTGNTWRTARRRNITMVSPEPSVHYVDHRTLKSTINQSIQRVSTGLRNFLNRILTMR